MVCSSEFSLIGPCSVSIFLTNAPLRCISRCPYSGIRPPLYNVHNVIPKKLGPYSKILNTDAGIFRVYCYVTDRQVCLHPLFSPFTASNAFSLPIFPALYVGFLFFVYIQYITTLESKKFLKFPCIIW